jgi:hypothetical protein
MLSGEWHLPFIKDNELEKHGLDICKKKSMARCARVSYLNHDGTKPTIEQDIQLADWLSDNAHWSPAEHQATPISMFSSEGITHMDKNGERWSANFKGWVQHRQTL